MLLLLGVGARAKGESGGGGRIIASTPRDNGGFVVTPLTRKRWEEIVAAEAAVEEARLKALAIAREEQRQEALAAVQSAQDAILETFDKEAQGHATAGKLTQLTNALEAFNSAKSLTATMERIDAVAKTAQLASQAFEMQDEEGAIALLLLH